MRAFLVAAAVTLAAALLYGLVTVGLFRFDAHDLQVDGSVVALALLLYALPFAAGAWAGTRRGLRELAPRAAVLYAAAGALTGLLAITVAGGIEAGGLLVALVGVAAGAVLALRTVPR